MPVKLTVRYNNQEHEIRSVPKSLGSLIEEIHNQILKNKEYCRVLVKQEDNQLIENELQYISLIQEAKSPLKLNIDVQPLGAVKAQKQQDSFLLKSKALRGEMKLNSIIGGSLFGSIFLKFV